MSERYTGSDEFLAEIWNHTNVGVDNQEDWIDELSAIGVEGRQQFARTLRAAADALDAPTRHTPSVGSTSNNKKRPDGRARNDDNFDFTKYPSRHVALHVMYAGWKYKGFASQGAEQSGVATVEECLFRALKRVRLIAPDATWKNCDYTRCGRTDAGVSAVGQVVSAKLRCRVPFNDGDESEFDLTNANESIADEDEIDYPATLNRALPQDIRVIGWAYVSPRFSARFACDFRHYKYFFANWGAGGLDFKAMNDAAGRLVGEHDYRNFCKMDAKNVHNYRRRINSCRVVTAADAHDDGARGAMGLGGNGNGNGNGNNINTPGVAHIEVIGTAFLWHQVRCIAAVLFLVGLGREPPSIVSDMLDLTKFPRKPQYEMAPEEPLTLWRCAFGGVRFRTSKTARAQLELHAAQCTHRHMVRAGVWAETLAHVRVGEYIGGGCGGVDYDGEITHGHLDNGAATAEALSRVTALASAGEGVAAGGNARAAHVPLSRRATEPTYEERVEQIERTKKGRTS